MKPKRFLACLLMLSILVSLLSPAVSQAAEVPQSHLSSSNMTAQGSNGFGNLLAQEITLQQTQLDEEVEAGFSIRGLTFSGNTATVTYDALRESLLVVAVYTENGLQLLSSGKVTVSPDRTEAAVTLDGNMPEYFYAGAYLLDITDYTPLCEEYTTPMYTRDMQELLASTVDDYDPEKVYNLDDDKTTNFAVFTEDTTVIREQAGVNTVVSADDDARIYVIEHADNSITSLQEGDILAYPYADGQILIVKVASITVTGSTATITGTDLEIEEVFDAVKIESGADTSDFSVDTSTIGEGLTYLGLTQSPESRSISGNDQVEEFYGYEIDQDAITGSLGIALAANVDFYVSMYRQFLDVTIDGDVSFTLTISGSKEYRVSVGNFAVSPIPGLYIAIEPTAVYRFSGNATFTFGYGFMVGFSAEHNNGSPLTVQNRSSNPTMHQSLKFSGSIFMGIDMNPQISILSDSVFEAGLNTLVGIELSGTLEYNNDNSEPTGDIVHACRSCVDGDITLVIELTVYAQFLGNDDWTLDEKILDFNSKIGKFYWSMDEDTFALTACPHRRYRVIVELHNAAGDPVPNVPVAISSGESMVANSNGIACFYLPAGSFTVTAELDGQPHSVKFHVRHMARKVLLTPDSQDEELPSFAGTNPDIFVDANTVIGHGTWGATVYWALYGDGTMHIYGEGSMPLCTDIKYIPWHDYRSNIVALVVDDGVATIGAYAFTSCRNLKEVRLPEGLLEIENRSFYECTSLEAITFPSSLTYIEDNSFYGCTSLTEVSVPCNLGSSVFVHCTGLERVDLSDSITSIGSLAFSGCYNIRSIVLPSNLTYMGYRVFEACTSLTEIVIPGSLRLINHNTFARCTALQRLEIQSGVEEISYSAFYQCTALTEISFPETLKSISTSAFSGCTALKEVTIPANTHEYAFQDCTALEKVTFLSSVTSLGKAVFKNCTALRAVTMPNSITTINESAFSGCKSLEQIDIPDSITLLRNSIFADCTALSNCVIPETVTSIGDAAFMNCTSLTEVQIPRTVTYLGGSAFKGCTGLTEIFIPNNVKSYGNYTFQNCTNLERVVIEDGASCIGYAAFYGCTGLQTVVIPDSVSTIDAYAFQGCTSLTEITLPSRITTLNTGLFRECTALAHVVIPESVEIIRGYVFYNCTALTEITIPSGVLKIEDYVFNKCTALTTVVFRGNPTTIGRAPFYKVVATVYYPADNPKWTTEKMKSYGSGLTWVPYTLDEAGNMIPTGEESLIITTEENMLPEETVELASFAEDPITSEAPTEAVSPNAIFGGDYTAEIIDNSYICKTATFSGLVPGEEYVMLALVHLDADDILAADNLLAILQGTAGSDGTLTFRYIQRVDADISYVVACGTSGKNLRDATITFPRMRATGELHTIHPTVVYGGDVLTEGVDYQIFGTVSFAEPGTYTCYIQGIHGYAGTVTCTYTVDAGNPLGDVNGDDLVDATDAYLIILYYQEVLALTEIQFAAADVNGDGRVDTADAYLLLLS